MTPALRTPHDLYAVDPAPIDGPLDAHVALLERIDRLARAADPAITRVHASLSVELAAAMDDLRQAARAVTELAEFLTRNPNALISGRERSARPR